MIANSRERHDGNMGACGHAYPLARERAAGRHQRQYALGVGPQRQCRKVDVLLQVELAENVKRVSADR